MFSQGMLGINCILWTRLPSRVHPGPLRSPLSQNALFPRGPLSFMQLSDVLRHVTLQFGCKQKYNKEQHTALTPLAVVLTGTRGWCLTLWSQMSTTMPLVHGMPHWYQHGLGNVVPRSSPSQPFPHNWGNKTDLLLCPGPRTNPTPSLEGF